MNSRLLHSNRGGWLAVVNWGARGVAGEGARVPERGVGGSLTCRKPQVVELFCSGASTA